MAGSWLSVHFALRLAEANVSPRDSPYCLSSVTFLRYSMGFPWRSRRGCVVMSTGFAFDVLCSAPYPACCGARCIVVSAPWTIAVPGLAQPFGLSRATPLECFNSTAPPFWLVEWFSGNRGFGRLLFRDFSGNRWALQDNAFWTHQSVDRSSFAPGPAQSGKAHWV